MNAVEPDPQHNGRILIADDDELVLDAISDFLTDCGYVVVTAVNGMDAYEKLLQDDFDCLITDINMPYMDGIEFMEKTFQAGYQLPVIILTGFGSVDSAVEAIRNGATDYVSKPFNGSELVHKVEDAITAHQKSQSFRDLTQWINDQGTYSYLFGTSAALQKLFQQAASFIDSNHSILLCGEKGVGRKDLARLIHAQNPVPEISFEEIDPVEMEPEILRQVMLQRNAPADATLPGTLRSVLITEIHSLPDSINRDPAWTSPDILPYPRIFAMTTPGNLNRMLDEHENRFFNFIHRNTLTVPPLRERKEDIPLLAQRFLKKMCNDQETPPVLSPDAVHALMLYNWPGNITELESRIKGATVMAIGPQIFKHHIFADDEMASQDIPPFKEAKEMFEITYITNLLKKSKGNITLAANISNKDRKNLYQKIQKYGIDVNQFRS